MAEIQKRTKKDGEVTYTIRVCTGELNGKKVRVTKTVTPPPGLTEKKLKKWIDDEASKFEKEAKEGTLITTDMTVAELLELFMKEHSERSLKDRTTYDYEGLCSRIVAALGHLKVKNVKPAHLMAFYKNLAEDGVRLDSSYTAAKALLDKLPKGGRKAIRERSGVSERTFASLCNGSAVSRKTALAVADAAGMPLSRAFIEHSKAGGRLNGNTVQHYHRMLSSVFTKAVQWGLVAENPCKRAEAPKAQEVDVRALEEKDVVRLLEALQDAPTQYSVITQLALLTGARRGEICALRWSDIDMGAGTISIERTLQRIPGKGTVFNPPKTKRSRRCVKVGPDCVQLLQEYRQHQKAERFKIGSEWVRRVEIEGKRVENDLLFTKWNGAPMDPDDVTTWFGRFLAAHNLPAVHFHSLRHTNASLLIAAHVPVTTVSGRLGHAKTSTTTDIYAGFIRSADAAAAEALTGVFDRIREKSYA